MRYTLIVPELVRCAKMYNVNSKNAPLFATTYTT